MTAIITPEMGHSGGGTEAYESRITLKERYDYEYPKGVNLQPGTRVHDEIVTRILNRARQSFEVMQLRHPAWNRIDDTLTAYIAPDVVEQKVTLKDARKPVSIVVPYSFATLETILTYFTGAFLQDPVFQYEGASSEDMIGSKLLELCIANQMKRSGGALALHTMWRDSIAYSIGCLAAGWRRETGKRVVKSERPLGWLQRLTGKAQMQKKTVPYLFYEGCDLQNIDPYLILPDPNQPIHKISEMEFFGWIEEVPLMTLLDEELWPDSDLFNVRYLQQFKEQYTEFTVDPSRRGYKYGLNERRKMFGTTNSKTVINMYVTIIPKDWELGKSEYPEKWVFQVVDGKVLTKCRPLDLVHNQFPVVIASPDFDGYSVAPTSRLELIDGLQTVINFLFNSHMANVRRAVNNMFLIDPSLVNVPDFEDPSGGLLVRLRRAAWGRGVEGAMQQLSVVDVTARHIQDAFQTMDLGGRVTGANENAMGMMRAGSERRSATEAGGAMQSTMNRMERMAKVVGEMAMNPLAYLLAFHTQQLMSEDTYVKIVGDWVTDLQTEYQPQQKVKVSPFDLLVEFDCIPRDGSLPYDVSGISERWVNLYQVLAQNPQVGAQFDMVRIFKHIARLMGAKDINSFAAVNQNMQTQVQPDQAVESQVQKGNLVPIQASATPEMAA